MKVLIVEDERPAAERLQTLLALYDPSIELEGRLESIEESVNYLNSRAHPDLMLVDIHLSDGHSFEIFKNVNYNNPIIFTTAFDNYAIDAFKLVSIDYILKPVTQQALAAAMNKFKSLVDKFSSKELNEIIAAHRSQPFKERFLGKVGSRLFFIETENISFFRADNKIVYMIDRKGGQYLIEYTLERLEQLLDPKKFFRSNRTYIVSNKAIQMVKRINHNRLRVHAEAMSQADDIVISRERVADFKQWAQM